MLDPFSNQMSYKWTKPRCLSVLSYPVFLLRMRRDVNQGYFDCLVLYCCVFSPLVVLASLPVLAK